MVKMIKFKFNCSRTFTVLFLICSLHQLVIASSSFQSLGHQLSSHNGSPKRRSFFESFKSSYSVIPNKLRQISIMNMLTGKRKNRKPADDEENQLFYSEVVSNPAIFSSVYSEKLAPQFQSVFQELDESYAKNPPSNLGAQLALKPNGGLSFQPVIDLTGNNQPTNSNQNDQTNNQNNNQPNGNTNDQQTSAAQMGPLIPVGGTIAQLSPISNQINSQITPIGNQISAMSSQITPIGNQITSMGSQITPTNGQVLGTQVFSGQMLSGPLQPNANANGKPDALSNFKSTLKDNSVLSSNLLTTNVLSNLNNLLGQQSNRNHFMFINRPGLSVPPQLSTNHHKLSEASLTAAASGSPFSKQHFSLSNSLTTNLLNLKNKFSQQKNQNYLKSYKNYKNYKDTMLGQVNGGAMLAAANQYQYFQQRPPNHLTSNLLPSNLAPTAYFQPLQASFNRYQMISSPSNMKKNCRKCPSGKKKAAFQQSFGDSGYGGGGGKFNANSNFNKGQDYASNLISNNVRQKQQFYSSMMQEKFRPMTGGAGGGGYAAAATKTNFNSQKQNSFYKPIADDGGTQIKVGSDIITMDDIEAALRRNNLHKVTNKDAQVYAQLHNMLMNSINQGYQVDSKVNVEDGRASRMLVKGKVFDDGFAQSTKGWRPKISQQQEEIRQVKDEPLFDEPQIKETDQQQKINDEEDFNQIKETDQQVKLPAQQPAQQPVFTQQTTSQWQPVKRPNKTAGGTKTPVKPPKKGGVKSPPTKSPVKGAKSPTKLAKLQLANNSTDNSSDSGSSSADRSSANSTSISDDTSKRETEDVTNLTSSNNTSAALFTQTGQTGTRVLKKIKRRKKKRITSDKNSDSLLTAVRKANKSQAAKLVANSFEDQVKTDVSSEAEATTASSGQLVDSTTNGNNEVQFDDTTSVSEEQNDQRSNRVTSTTVALSTMPNKQEQVKGRMLAKKRKVMESITTTTESSDSLIESSPDTSRGLEETSNLEGNSGDSGDNTYFNVENITDSNIRNFELINNKEKKNVIFEDTSPFVDDLDNVRSKLKLKSAVRKKKVKSTNRNRAALTSINSPFGDFTASITTDEEDGGRRTRKNKNRVVEPDESIENMHFRIDDVDADDYDALNRENLNEEDKENDGFNNSFSNENTEISETRNQLDKIHPTTDGRSAINQTLFNSLLKSNRLINSTHLGNVQPITTLHLKMNMNESPDAEDEALDTMDVNSTIADLVQKIHQANGGDMNVINEYRNYFTEDEFDLLTDLLKREANKTSTVNSTSAQSSTSKLSTSESIRKEHLLNHLYYTDYDERRSDALKTIATINSSSPIYLNGKGQASLKEYYLNKADSKPDGVDVLINIQEKKSPIRGQPGVDYPIISNAPKKTTFSCKDKAPGLYPDYESGCIRYVQCSINVNSVQQQTFYCANGTLFDQRTKVCSWWYNVDCQSPDSPESNAENRMKSDRNGLSIPDSPSNPKETERTTEPPTLHPVYVPNSTSNQ